MARYRFTLLVCFLILAGCSDEPAPKEPEKKTVHIWQGQVEMYDEAKAVGQEVNEMQKLKEERMKNLD